MPITLAATGHRPQSIGWPFDLRDPRWQQVKAALARYLDARDVNCMVSGMALGFDTLFANVALERQIPLVAAVPFRGQERRWPAKSQAAYARLLAQADKVVYVCDGTYTPHKMQRRNEWMVDHADALVALWDGCAGGTGNCVSYARRNRCAIEVARLDPHSITATGCPDFLPL